MEKLTYTAQGEPKTVYVLGDLLVSVLNNAIGVEKISNVATKLNEAISAQPPRPEEVVGMGLNEDFVEALRRYHTSVDQEPVESNISDLSKTAEIPNEWYINPVFSFRGNVGTVRDEEGRARKVAINIANIVREGEVRIEYSSKEKDIAGLTLTMEYDLSSKLSLTVLRKLNEVFEAVKKRYGIVFSWTKQ